MNLSRRTPLIPRESYHDLTNEKSGVIIATMDELDRRLVIELAKDARQSSAELSAKIGVSDTTIRRRIRQLQDRRIITFAAIPDPIQLGYNLTAIIALEVDLNKIDGVAKSLTTCENVRYVSLCTGNHDIFVGAWFRSSAELKQFVKDYIGDLPGIRKTETFIVLDVIKEEVGWLKRLEQADTSSKPGTARQRKRRK
jgi:Lrp/AsnC family transcriptional regulator for asnA, asnC and gidA